MSLRGCAAAHPLALCASSESPPLLRQGRRDASPGRAWAVTAPRPLTRMDKADRVRACYLHACLKYVNSEYLTNASLRQRFGVEPKNLATISRYIKEAVEMGEIVPYDPRAAPKMMKYVPWWAAPEGRNT